MLPEIVQLEINMEEITEDLPEMGKSFLFDFDKGDFVLKGGKLVEVRGLESLKMWIKKTMKTERFRFKIYEDMDYGITIEDLIGSNYPRNFVEAEIEREVTTSLTQHTHIDSVINWKFERVGSLMKVNFTVVSPIGTFNEEVTFNV